MPTLEKTFELKQRGSTVRQEIIAGLTTFLAMVYSVIVVPNMLGAAGLRDIGYYFPPEDDQYKGISSMLLLEKVNSLLKERGLQAYNIDIMVISETPKLKPHIDTMKANLQSVLEIPLERISIKATTNEMLGAIGRREGIAAQAVVSVYEGEV